MLRRQADRIAVNIHDFRDNARKRARGRAGFVSVMPGSGEIMMQPVSVYAGVDDGAAAAASRFVADPRLRIDRLADCADEPQRESLYFSGDSLPSVVCGWRRRCRKC